MSFDAYSDDEDEVFDRRAILPVASTGPREFDPNHWSECSAKEFLRNVMLEAEKYPSVICSKLEIDKTIITSNNVNDSVMFFSTNDDEKFWKCPPKYRLTQSEIDQIINDYSTITTEIRSKHTPNIKIKYSLDSWKKICKKSTSLPDENRFGELEQVEIIKILEVLYKFIIENLLNDEPINKKTMFWLWLSLHLLYNNQTNNTYSLLRNISRSLSERRKEILQNIENKNFNEDDIQFVANSNRIIFIISHVFRQADLTDS